MISFMLSGLLEGLIGILFPRICCVCKDTLKDQENIGGCLCISCWNKIRRNVPPFCYRCGRELEKLAATGNTCQDCAKSPLAFDRAASPCRYEGTVKELIHQFKYGGKEYLARLLGRLMADFAREYNLGLELIGAIIPMPLHASRLRERDFNQARSLSGYLGREFRKPVLDGVLVRKQATPTQTGLEEKQRFANVKGSFAVSDNRAVKGATLLLVDDVLTTGATASEATAALKGCGAKTVFVLTLAN